MSLFYTLPDQTRLTVRKFDKRMRRVITHVHNRWQGDRASFYLTADPIQIRLMPVVGLVGYRVLNLITGSLGQPDVTNLKQFQYWSGRDVTLDPGEALFVFRRKHSSWRFGGENRDLDVTIYLHAFSPDDRVVEALSVARDAVLADEIQSAYDIARRAADHSHAPDHAPDDPGRTTNYFAYGMFVALCLKERAMLRNQETANGE